MTEFYESDNRARDMVHLAIGLYKYRDEVDGFLQQSLYWAAISFEYVIRLTARYVPRHIDSTEDLTDIISDICSSPRVKRSKRENLRRTLGELKAIRNRMFHPTVSPRGLIPVTQVTRMLKGVSKMVRLDFQKVNAQITYEQLRQLRDRVVKIPMARMPRQIPDKGEICDTDFDELDVLYEKCKFLHFRKLRVPLSPLRLKPEEMSELIPTTGTIWLPWVAREPGDRAHVHTIVLGANFTPTFIRIGIDLGSRAYEAKKTYYTLLLNGDFEALLDKLDETYYFIDTFWYNHIKDHYPIETEKLRPKIQKALEETIRKTKAQTPMKGHQFLIGKIFRRNTKEFSNFLVNPPQTIRDIFSELIDIVKRVEDHQKRK